MSQHDYDLANQAGAAFRADLNLALAAILGMNSGASAPATTVAGMLWYDTSNAVVKQRNAANSAWITRWTVADDLDAAWTAYTPSLTADTGAWGALSVTNARYRQFGKTLMVHWTLSASVSSGSPTEFRITYPGGQSGQNSNSYVTALVSNNGGASVLGLCRQTSSTYASFQQIGGAAFAGACSFTAVAIFEMA